MIDNKFTCRYLGGSARAKCMQRSFQYRVERSFKILRRRFDSESLSDAWWTTKTSQLKILQGISDLSTYFNSTLSPWPLPSIMSSKGTVGIRPRQVFASDKSSFLVSDGISRQSNDPGDQSTSLRALTAHSTVIALAQHQKIS